MEFELRIPISDRMQTVYALYRAAVLKGIQIHMKRFETATT
jgi:hypothetical protein